MKLLIATRNPHKLEEILSILGHPDLELLSCADVPNTPEVEEDGSTLEANAIKKAVVLALATGMWTLADDTGLEVEALDGAPGVLSARYAGAEGDPEANCARLLRELTDIANRNARFRCVIALSSPAGIAQYVEGICRGAITDEKRGAHGFGYDPIFIPEGADETFAELTPEAKHAVSHRGLALQRATQTWDAVFGAADLEEWPT